MRVGLVATLSTPVRPAGSGSVEGLVWLLARELSRLGHEVTVFAAAGSRVDDCRVVTVPGTYGGQGMPEDYQHCELLNLAAAIERSADLDVVHSHSYLLGVLVERLSRAPMVHTLHTQPYDQEAALARLVPDVAVTALSRYQWHAFPDICPPVVPHGLDPDRFTLRVSPERRLCYLGRFLPEKGVLAAIEIARRLDLPLVLAGPENQYFRDVVRPRVDGRHVDYVGPVGGRARDELLGASAALVYPLVQGEPFGLVMVESMLCGTPVLATPVGAAVEVVEPGVTGDVAVVGELPAAGPGVLSLDRTQVRAAAVERFSATRMARAYADIYASAARRGPVADLVGVPT